MAAESKNNAVLSKQIKFIDLFAGIGGFHLGLHQLGMECVFACEIDKYARQTYKANFKTANPTLFEQNFHENIMDVNSNNIPDFDILCAGFPCQPFSQAGQKKGFSESKSNQGNMFFEIMKIVENKKPKILFLENVRHLIKHDDGTTFSVIKNNIKKAGYNFYWKMIKASDCGLPQHRPRVYIVCFRNDLGIDNFKFPKPKPLKFTMSEVFQGECNKKIGYTLRVGGKSSGINDRRNWDSYLVNGTVVKLQIAHGTKMMGLPSHFQFPVSKTQAMKQLGNGVAVDVVAAIGEEIQCALRKEHNIHNPDYVQAELAL